MSEERADERGAAPQLGELRNDAVSHMFAVLQRSAGVVRALRMAPDRLIGVEILGVAGQVLTSR